MRFLVDAQLPPALARALTASGFPASHVVDMGLLSASDEVIWREAAKVGAVIITKDGDFAQLHRQGRAGTAVIWLRVGNTATEKLVRWLVPLMPRMVAALNDGETLIEVQG